jgi:hypothetical protein
LRHQLVQTVAERDDSNNALAATRTERVPECTATHDRHTGSAATGACVLSGPQTPDLDIGHDGALVEPPRTPATDRHRVRRRRGGIEGG